MKTMTDDNNVKYYGPDKTYRAFNGHMMVGSTYKYGTDGEWRTVSHSAQHADTCHCWDSDEGFTGMEDW
jgi:hypothetical protein